MTAIFIKGGVKLLTSIIRNRIESLESLHGDIQLVLKDLDHVALDKNELTKREHFVFFSKETQQIVADYKMSLEKFLTTNPNFKFEDYQFEFKERDEHLSNLLIEYVSLREGMAG